MTKECCKNYGLKYSLKESTKGCRIFNCGDLDINAITLEVFTSIHRCFLCTFAAYEKVKPIFYTAEETNQSLLLDLTAYTSIVNLTSPHCSHVLLCPKVINLLV